MPYWYMAEILASYLFPNLTFTYQLLSSSGTMITWLIQRSDELGMCIFLKCMQTANVSWWDHHTNFLKYDLDCLCCLWQAKLKHAFYLFYVNFLYSLNFQTCFQRDLLHWHGTKIIFTPVVPSSYIMRWAFSTGLSCNFFLLIYFEVSFKNPVIRCKCLCSLKVSLVQYFEWLDGVHTRVKCNFDELVFLKCLILILLLHLVVIELRL